MQIKIGTSSVSALYCYVIHTTEQCVSLLSGKCTFFIKHSRHTKKKKLTCFIAYSYKLINLLSYVEK
jgi:hypothetical protein